MKVKTENTLRVNPRPFKWGGGDICKQLFWATEGYHTATCNLY